MKHVFSLLIFSLSCITLYPQEKSKEPTNYVFPEFTQGVVLMKTGIKSNALLNYNSLTEEMIFEYQEKKLAITKEELELIDTVFIRDRKFVVLNNKFSELIYHSTFDLYAEYKCKLYGPGKPSAYGGTSQTSASVSASSFKSGGLYYELKLPDDYETNPYTWYWIKKNGELYRFTNLRQLMNLYENKKNLFKDYVKKYDIKFENQKSIIQLIQYLETD